MITKLISIIILLSIFGIAFLNGLSSITINGGNYGYDFVLFITGTTETSITKSINLPIKLLVDGDELEAKCSVENTASGQAAFYSCIYDNNIDNENNIYIKYEENNIYGINENSLIKPFAINIKFLEAINLEYYDGNWQYILKGELNAAQEITLGFITYMNIKVNNTNKISGCILSSKTENLVSFNCKINKEEQNLSDKISLVADTTYAEGLTFTPVLASNTKITIYKYVSFIEGKDLLFSGEKWHFTIIVPYQAIPIGTQSIIDILYNGALSSATCISNENSMLDCTVNKDDQNGDDVIKIHFIKSETSTLTWSDLTKIYEVPLAKELQYINSYELTYTSTNLWSFKIKIGEVILPMNSFVKIDIKLNDEWTYAKCYYSNELLNCKTETINKEDTLSLKISHEKKYGSITWTNIISQDIYIPVTAQITYESAYNLRFENNVWYFILKASSYEEMNSNFPISIKINYGEDRNIGRAFCFQDRDNLALFNCETYYENQNSNDLILLSGDNGEESVIWGTSFETKYITLSASLHFIKSYDLIYSTESEKWTFKIEIEDDLPNDSKLILDILYSETNADTATCFYNNKILSCTRDSPVQNPRESLNIVKDKTSGTITWENIEESKIDIPLSVNTNLIRAYGLFYTGIWSFYVDVEYIGVIPNNSYFYIDILQNDEEKKAICEISESQTQAEVAGTSTTMSCHLEDNDQSILDDIRINRNKKYGSIYWNEEIEDDIIEEESADPILFHILDAYDLEFVNNRWSFKIVGKADREIYQGEIFTLEVKYILLEGEYDTTAKCWVQDRSNTDKIYFLCNVEKEEQTNKGLIQLSYFQTETSKIIWNGGIDDNYPIIMKTSLILLKAYDMNLDRTWKFRMDVLSELLPPGARIIVDILIGSNTKSIYCTSLNSTQIICDTGSDATTELIKLSQNKISESSVLWIENRQNDYLIYLNVQFELVTVFNLFFNENTNKWSFLIKKSGNIPKGSKLSVDILYNDLPSVATCFNNNNNDDDELNCSVDKDEQNNMDLVQLNHIKTGQSSITWVNLSVDEKISLISNLNFLKADNLRTDSNHNWIFEIYITDENIPNYSKFIIDIYYKINNVQHTSQCICYLDNKILYCQTNLNSYELVSLKLTKTENSLSTVTWANRQEYNSDNIRMNITASLQYTDITTISYVDNKYYFYVNLNNNFPQEGEVLIDIDIGGTIITCLCKAEIITKLKCQIKNEDYRENTNIFIVQKNTEHSTVNWVNLETHVQINTMYLIFKGAYDKKSKNETHTEFKILTDNKNLPDGTIINVRINYIDANGNILSTELVSCISHNEFLVCDAPKKSGAVDFNIYLASSSSNNGGGVIWSNGNNANTQIYSNLNLNLEVNSFNYNSDNNCYEFSFQDNNYHSGSTFFVTDILIGGTNTYAYCTYENAYFHCKTNTIEYNENNDVKISKTQSYGNVNWVNINENENKKINTISLEISQIYNLYFDTTDSKWKFKMKTNKSLSTEKTYILDILISGLDGLANCVLNEEILECTVNAENQSRDQLIRLNSNKNGDFKIVNIDDRQIPLNIELIFNNIEDIYYSANRWFFTLNTQIFSEDITINAINADSLFTVDVKYGSTNGIANCYKNSISAERTLILSCHTKDSVSENSMISLNPEKSLYSSITWKETIPSNLDIFINAQLKIDICKNLQYDTSSQKWSFEMKLESGYNYPLNTKVKIDIKYNDNDSTATCVYTYNTEYKFICTPDIEEQNDNDYFEILEEKNSGTVTYLNYDINKRYLIIYSNARMTFQKAYDLVFTSNNKITFKIKVSQCTLQSGRYTKVQYKDNDYYKTAFCRNENNILLCESLSYSYYSSNTIYLTNNNANAYAQWDNLVNNEHIYVNYYINLENAFGCLMENKWKFNVKYGFNEHSERNYINNYVLLDILVNDIESTAICKISDNYILKCECNYNNQNANDIIKIVGNEEPYSGTVYFGEILDETTKLIKPAELTIDLVSIDYDFYSNKLDFYIEGTMDYSTVNKAATFTEIEILINKTNGNPITSRASCEISYYQYESGNHGVFLDCSASNYISRDDGVKINIDLEGKSKYVNFILTTLTTNEDLTIKTRNDYNYGYNNYDDYYNEYYDDDYYAGNDKEHNDTDTKNSTSFLDTIKSKAIKIGIICGAVGGTLAIGGFIIYKIVSSSAAKAAGKAATKTAANINQPTNLDQIEIQKNENANNNIEKDDKDIKNKRRKSKLKTNEVKIQDNTLKSTDSIKLNLVSSLKNKKKLK